METKMKNIIALTIAAMTLVSGVSLANAGTVDTQTEAGFVFYPDIDGETGFVFYPDLDGETGFVFYPEIDK